MNHEVPEDKPRVNPVVGRLQCRPWTKKLSGSMVVRGESAFLLAGDLVEVAIGDPAKMKTIGRRALPSPASAFTLDEHGVVCAVDGDSLQIVELLNSGDAEARGVLTFDPAPVALLQSGGLIFLACGSGERSRLLVVDAGDPARPRQVGEVAAPVGESKLAFRRDHLFLSGPEGIVAIDVCDPEKPEVVSSSPGTMVLTLLATEDRLLMLDSGNLRCFDLAGLPELDQIWSLPVSENVVGSGGMTLVGDWLHILTFEDREIPLGTPMDLVGSYIVSLDLSDFDAPRLAGKQALGTAEYTALASVGGHLFVMGAADEFKSELSITALREELLRQ